VENEEAILGVTLGFQRAAPPDVDRTDSMFQERRAYHQEAMALQRIFFGAHQGNDIAPGEGKGSLDTFHEIMGAAARRVIHAAVFVIHARISGPAAKSFPEKFVVNTSRSKSGLERFAIELRKTQAGGAAADITERFDLMLGKNGKKNVDLKIRVPDGEELAGGTGVDIHERHT